MSELVEKSTTLETLNYDCLFKIFSHLGLEECFRARAVSRLLNSAISKYLSVVETLPVLLSKRRSRRANANLRAADNPHLQEQSFGKRSPLRFKDSFRMLAYQRHFRKEDFLILRRPKQFDEMIQFIRKYMPNINKLALVIDYRNYFSNIPTILQLFGGRLKVLLLERTLRDSWEFYGTFDDSRDDCIKPSKEFYDSILCEENLEELYFFPKYTCKTVIGNRPNDYGQHFVRTMFGKLRVLHINYDGYTNKVGHGVGDKVKYHLDGKAYDKIEELSCCILKMGDRQDITFPNIRKCILPVWLIREASPWKNVKILCLLYYFQMSDFSMKILASLPNLERFECTCVRLTTNVSKQFVNRTIKHIHQREMDLQNPEENIQNWHRYFAGLETFSVAKPSMRWTIAEIRGDDFWI